MQDLIKIKFLVVLIVLALTFFYLLKLIINKKKPKSSKNNEDLAKDFVNTNKLSFNIFAKKEDLTMENNRNSNNSKEAQAITPKIDHVRTLDNEHGGLELETAKISKEEQKDAWDDRSEEVDKMGSVDSFNSTGIRSFIARNKRDRIRAKKLMEMVADGLLSNKDLEKIVKKEPNLKSHLPQFQSNISVFQARSEGKSNEFSR
jgi:hypothetical protein